LQERGELRRIERELIERRLAYLARQLVDDPVRGEASARSLLHGGREEPLAVGRAGQDLGGHLIDVPRACELGDFGPTLLAQRLECRALRTLGLRLPWPVALRPTVGRRRGACLPRPRVSQRD